MKIISAIFLMSMPHTSALTQPGIIVSSILMVLAVASVIMGIMVANRRKQWVSHSTLTQGTIIDVYKKYLRSDKAGHHPVYFPTVVFNVNGKRFQIVGEVGSDKTFDVGQDIPVRYNPINPDEAIVGKAEAPGMNPTVFYAIGGVMVFLGIVLMM
jgi:Protein of unknown function (DUF3592)